MKYLKEFWPLYILTGFLFFVIVGTGSRSVITMAENAPMIRENLIVVDAGHGGEDGGAVSCTGVPESKINLEIALKLNDLLQLLGYDTYMIRTEDISVYTEGKTLSQKKISDLKNRVRMVNERKNCILVSIHQNTFPSGKYSGAQVFYNDEKAKEMAVALQKSLAETMGTNSKRPCKKSSGVYLMEHINRPGLLVECGFLSNHEEEAKLRTCKYQQKIACVIASTLSQILSNT